jgi:hypothetical protein
MSLLGCIRSDGSLDIMEAFQRLNDDDGGEVNVGEEPSIMDCIMPEGGLDVGKFLRQQNLLSLFEMSILKEAGVIDNGCSPTGNVASRERLIAVGGTVALCCMKFGMEN